MRPKNLYSGLKKRISYIVKSTRKHTQKLVAGKETFISDPLNLK